VKPSGQDFSVRARPAKTHTAEALKAAVRRAVPLVIVCAVAGIVVVNLQKQLAGPVYSASASVLLDNRGLAEILTETQAPYVDPRRESENALALARATELYERVAAANRALGSPGSIRGLVSVTGDPDSDVISFTATGSDPERVTDVANAVAHGYVDYRSQTYDQDAIDAAISRLRDRQRESPNDTQTRTLLERLEILRTISAGTPDAAVINEATGAAKIAPNPVRDSILGAAIGIVVALLLAGAREAFNTRVQGEADVEDALGRPVLASIPSLPRTSGLVTVGRHESRYSDVYALLAANIMQQHGEGKLLLAVTSAVAGEGKTTTAANLAVAFARRGSNVIIADFDVRKPAINAVFRIPAVAFGVTDIVRGGRELESSLWSFRFSSNGDGAGGTILAPGVVPTSQRRLASSGDGAGALMVLPAGGTDSGGRIAQSPQMQQLLKKLRASADVVILDTPPALLTVEMAELSRLVDSVLVVVRRGKVTRRSLSALGRQAQSWPADVAGAVLTAADGEPSYSDYYAVGG
jgi:succinoglycan biosynthesis transport protein ExoP